jgi:DNA-binding MarR family transcriptional regulator
MKPTFPSDSVALIEEGLVALMQLGRVDHLHHWLSEHAGVQLERPAYVALAILADRGPMRLSDLAAAGDVGAPTMSRLVDRLLDLGLVEATVNSSDRRALDLQLTGAGRNLLEHLLTARRAAVEGIVACWSEEERAMFGKLLRQFSEAACQKIKADNRWHKH